MGLIATEQENSKMLNEFRTLVLSNISKFWRDKKDIKIAIHETLADFAYRKELVGWIRGDKAVDAGPLAEQIAALVKENTELRTRINQDSNIRFSGLSYEQLKGLLENEKIEGSEHSNDLFQYLIIEGKRFAQGVFEHTINGRLARELVRLKILFAEQRGTSRFFTFTEDGHNFYLKALSLKI